MRTITKMEGDTHLEGKEIVDFSNVVGIEKDVQEFAYKASLSLVVIRMAWHKGCDFEDLADGFGKDAGTHGDWSAIRDSSHEAKTSMLERSLNYLEAN